MTDPINAARHARENLRMGLQALQSPGVPPQLMDVAEPVAAAMGELFKIEQSQGAAMAQCAPVALDAVRRALNLLQAQPAGHPAVDQAIEAVASSLSVVHGIARAAEAPGAAPGAMAAHPVQRQQGPGATVAVGPGGGAQPVAPAGETMVMPDGGQASPYAPAPAPQPAQAASPYAPAPAPQPAQAASPYVPAPAPQPAPTHQYAPTVQARQDALQAGGWSGQPMPQQQPMPPQQYVPPPQQQMPPPQQQMPPPQQYVPPQQYMPPQQQMPQQQQQMPPQQQPMPQQQQQYMPPQQQYMPPQQQMPQNPGYGPPLAGQQPQPSPMAQAPPPQPVPQPAMGGDGPPVRVEAELGAHSATNFYKGLSGNDVIDSGGIFVATYQIPPLGQNLVVKVSMPGGYEFEAMGVVRWTREADSADPHMQPGFGAQLTQISPEGRQLVYRYVRNREPLFHDDL